MLNIYRGSSSKNFVTFAAIYLVLDKSILVLYRL